MFWVSGHGATGPVNGRGVSLFLVWIRALEPVLSMVTRKPGPGAVTRWSERRAARISCRGGRDSARNLLMAGDAKV